MDKSDKSKNNQLVIISTVVVAFIVIISIVFFISRTKDNNDNDYIIHGAAENVSIGTKEFSYNNSKFEVNMEIPEISNLSSSFNTYINNKINTDISYTNIYNELTFSFDENAEVGKFFYDLTYDRYNCKDYVSLVLNQTIQLGDERVINKKIIYVIDAKESRLLNLKDVMENKVDYKRKIIEVINIDAFKERIELVGGNGLTNLSDEQQFYIKDGKLYIYFDASEIAPAIAGQLEFEMPFEFVDGLFKY